MCARTVWPNNVFTWKRQTLPNLRRGAFAATLIQQKKGKDMNQRNKLMSSMSDELITEEEAFSFLELEKESLRALATQGLLNVVEANGPQCQVLPSK